jgi:hypothetical protein
MAHDVFISYSARNKTTADAVCAMLEAHGIRCWIAPRDVLPGANWAGAIIEAIHQSRVLVLIFSAESNRSQQVMRELERAVSAGIPIVPFRIEDVVPSHAMEYYLGSHHWLDAITPPMQRHLERLAETLTKLLGEDGGERPEPEEFAIGASGASAQAPPARSREAAAVSRRVWLFAGGGTAILALLALAIDLRSRGHAAVGIPSPTPLAEAATPARTGTPPSTPTPVPPPTGTAITLQAPYSRVNVTPEDEGARGGVNETSQDLQAIFKELSSEFGFVPNTPFAVDLATDEATGRRTLSALGQSATAINGIFSQQLAASVSGTSSSIYAFVFLPFTGDLRGTLAFATGAYIFGSFGAFDRADVYPYWFRRGFNVWLQSRFSQAGFTLRPTAISDQQAGNAPALAQISSAADVNISSGAPAKSIDARGQAAVEYLAQKFGVAAVGRLLNENASGSIARFNGALQSLTNMTLDQFNDALSASLT